MKSTQNLPLRLKELRNAHHYSQEELAEKLNVSRQAVSRWENGKAVPDIDNLLFLAELYDVPLDVLVDELPCSQYENNNVDNLTEISAIIEILVLSIILTLSSNLPIISIPIAGGILVRNVYTKRKNRIVLILCILCICMSLYEIFILYSHYHSILGWSFVNPK